MMYRKDGELSTLSTSLFHAGPLADRHPTLEFVSRRLPVRPDTLATSN